MNRIVRYILNDYDADFSQLNYININIHILTIRLLTVNITLFDLSYQLSAG